jgi:hypothetical protein
MRFSPLQSIAIVGSLVAASLITAQPLAVASTAPPTLSKAQLRACMDQRDEIAGAEASISRRVKAFEAEDSVLAEQHPQLSEIKRRLNPMNDELIKTYNQLSNDYNYRLGAHKATRSELTRDIEKHESDRKAYDIACSSRPFLKSDESAVLKERAQARDTTSAR